MFFSRLNWKCQLNVDVGDIIMKNSISILTLILIVIFLNGCHLGPRVLRGGYPQYNQAIRELDDEHMLLNLVRLRYFDTPVFLQISSISSTYGINVSANATGTSVGSGQDSVTAGVGAGYSETPTITYSLPES